MIVASIDVETTGLDPEKAELLSVGCVIFDTAYPEYAPDVEVEFFVRHDYLIGHPTALVMNIELIKHCQDTDRLILKEIGDKLLSIFSRHLRVVFAGKNFASFDRLFLEANIHTWPKIQAHGGHRTLDPGSMYMLRGDPSPPNLRDCCVRAGVKFDPDLAHTALYDAQCVARCIYNFCWKPKV